MGMGVSHVQYIAAGKKILLAIGDVNDSWGGYVRGYSRTHTDLSECLQRQERGLLSKVCEPAYAGGGGGGGGEKSDVLSHDNITCRLQSLHM